MRAHERYTAHEQTLHLQVQKPAAQAQGLVLWELDEVDCWYGAHDAKHLFMYDLVLCLLCVCVCVSVEKNNASV